MVGRFLTMFFLYFFLIAAAVILGMYLMSEEIVGPVGYVIIVVAAVLIPMIFFNKTVFKTSGKDKKILQNGITARAEILEIKDTGVTINNIYYNVILRLKVMPDSMPAFEARASHLFSRVSMPNAGDILYVKYLTNDLTKVVILTEGNQSLDRDSAEELLKSIDLQNKALLANGKEADAEVLKYSETGILVNGDNPLIEFELEVTPDYGPKFFAAAKAPILSTSVSKYRKGSRIKVKYDPEDLTKVTIFHS